MTFREYYDAHRAEMIQDVITMLDQQKKDAARGMDTIHILYANSQEPHCHFVHWAYGRIRIKLRNYDGRIKLRNYDGRKLVALYAVSGKSDLDKTREDIARELDETVDDLEHGIIAEV